MNKRKNGGQGMREILMYTTYVCTLLKNIEHKLLLIETFTILFVHV